MPRPHILSRPPTSTRPKYNIPTCPEIDTSPRPKNPQALLHCLTTMPPTTDPVFHPSAHLDSQPSDLTLVSSDQVQFHIHRDQLAAPSTNCFNHLLFGLTREPVDLPEDSSLVSLILHLVYHIRFNSPPCARTILASFDSIRKYGLPTDQYFSPSSPLFTIVQVHLNRGSQGFALGVYIHAANLNLYGLAAAASPILISYPLTSIPPATSDRIPAVYLKKLYVLHDECAKALRRILNTLPTAHPLTQTCGAEGQQHFLSEWRVQAVGLILSPVPSEIYSPMAEI